MLSRCLYCSWQRDQQAVMTIKIGKQLICSQVVDLPGFGMWISMPSIPGDTSGLKI